VNARIVPFEITDYDDAVALWRSTEGILLGAADERDAIARYLARNDRMSHVARKDGRLVGAVLCGTDGRRGFLHHLAVAAPERRGGIGTALAMRALERLVQLGIEKCHLMVTVENADAQRFWEKLGWKKRDDVVLMSRVLTLR
jgi:putative acetyltransferase